MGRQHYNCGACGEPTMSGVDCCGEETFSRVDQAVGEIHRLCSDVGIKPGHIVERVKELSALYLRLCAERDRKKNEITKSTFLVGDHVIHVKTGIEYVIVGAPHNTVDEATLSPVYAYQLADISRQSTVWICAQSIMEDGRYVFHPDDDPTLELEPLNDNGC